VQRAPDATTDRSDVGNWVRDARAGSQAAYALLYRRFAPLVHSILLGRVRPALADELMQECFANAFERLAQLQDEDRFGAWISTIARRVVPAGSSREVQLDHDAEPASLDATPEQRAEAAQLLRAIRALPEAYRETLLLRLVEGLSGVEIAALTGLAPESVRVNLHRGMAKLRVALDLYRSPGDKA
jgi:RNA polymerase sigma-70 factor, ECF subfamily